MRQLSRGVFHTKPTIPDRDTDVEATHAAPKTARIALRLHNIRGHSEHGDEDKGGFETELHI
jgi:hypothetical protein